MIGVLRSSPVLQQYVRSELSENPACMGVGSGGQNGHLPPLEIGTKNQTFLENLKLAAKFRLNNFIDVGTTVYLPV